MHDTASIAQNYIAISACSVWQSGLNCVECHVGGCQPVSVAGAVCVWVLEVQKRCTRSVHECGEGFELRRLDTEVSMVQTENLNKGRGILRR